MKNNGNEFRTLGRHTAFLRIGFIMDPMEEIHLQYDSSMCLMIEAERRGHVIYYMEPGDLFVHNGSVLAEMRQVSTSRSAGFQILSKKTLPLKSLDVLVNRKDPPFDLPYLYLTHLLELLEPDLFIVNSPAGLRKANEKLYILNFPKWIPSTCVSNDPKKIERFWRKENSDVILKPLNRKGGSGIKLLPRRFKHVKRLLSQMIRSGTWIMAQRFLKAGLARGDKRVLLLNGKVIGQFRRIPKRGEFRANLTLGAESVHAELTRRERNLIRAIAPKLVRDGIYFAGLDLVDGRLIEINVTSPAGLTELTELEAARLEARIVDFLEVRALRQRFRKDL